MSDQEVQMDVENKDLTILESLDKEFAKKNKERMEEYYDYKEFEQAESKRKLMKRPVNDLVNEIYAHKQRELLQTDALGAVVIVMAGNNFGRMEDAKVFDDRQLETMVAGERKKVAILHEPMMMTLNMRKYWIGRGISWKIRYFFVWLVMRATFMMDIGILRFNIYFMRADGEYTIDPTKDWTPSESQRKLEAFLQLQARILKANLKAQLIADQGDQKRMLTLIWAFLIWTGVIVFMFLWTMNGGF